MQTVIASQLKEVNPIKKTRQPVLNSRRPHVNQKWRSLLDYMEEQKLIFDPVT
jgi:hypothetical protein